MNEKISKECDYKVPYIAGIKALMLDGLGFGGRRILRLIGLSFEDIILECKKYRCPGPLNLGQV